MGIGARRYRLPYPLPTRIKKRQAGYAVEAFGVPPRKTGSENQPIMTVLPKNHFVEPDRRGSSLIYSSARLALLPTQKWTKEFAEKVGEAAREDEAYQQVRKELE